MLEATYVGGTRTSVEDLPAEIRETYARIQAIHDRYRWDATNADRPVGDNIRLGRLDGKLRRLIEQHGLDYARVTFKLANQ